MNLFSRLPIRQFAASSRRRLAVSPIRLLALASAVTLAGCSFWQIPPDPDDYVGPGKSSPAQSLTDPALQAVTPIVPGDIPGNAAVLPGAAISSATMPANTQPTTSQPASQSATQQTPANAPIPEALSVQEAILTGLQHNIALRVQRLNVPQARAGEDIARSAFDPVISGSIQGGRTGSRGGDNDAITGNIGVTEFLPTGTTIDARLSSSNNFYSDASSSFGGNLTVTQALLRGAGLDVNLASLRQAELVTKLSQYELRGTAESLVADIELSYWDLAFAECQLVIFQDGLEVAQRQLDDTAARVRVDRLAPSEIPAAEAELAARRENLINARSALETTRMVFLQRLAPADRNFWDKKVNLTTLPFIPVGDMDGVDKHVEVAMRLRPDVNQAKLQIRRGDLEIVQTKNGLLPRLDVFLTLGKTGLASSFGESITGLNGPDYQALLGVRGDWDPINRAARASYRSSLLSKQQLEDTLHNLAQTVQLDVRRQYIDVQRTRLQIDASRATRIAREANLKVQQGKLAAGSGTSLLVAIAQRDLLTAQINEVQFVTSHLKSLVSLYRLEGSLLFRRGLDAPGATPITDLAWKK